MTADEDAACDFACGQALGQEADDRRIILVADPRHGRPHAIGASKGSLLVLEQAHMTTAMLTSMAKRQRRSDAVMQRKRVMAGLPPRTRRRRR